MGAQSKARLLSVKPFQGSWDRGLRVCPETIQMLWITQRDVTAHALAIAIATEDSKRTSHMLEHPSSLAVDGRK